MATSSAVNAGLTAPDEHDQAARAPTPKTPTTSTNDTERAPQDVSINDSSPITPTRHSFGGILGQRPLPEGPATAPEPSSHAEIKRDGSQRQLRDESQDVEMADAGNDGHGVEDDDGSDGDSDNGDGSRSSKKKKGQRFFCTEFPPCTLSFTRSEHLARHIRKHTGERPFQCHCSRRFSRLDNLRQHAQTVHVNEEIPAESLAATSTRFQRQIRTDRVRPQTSRSRASTLSGSGGPPHRGHSRNWSTSSIGSTTSSLGGDDNVRPRPPPLAMSSDAAARARLSLQTSGGIGSPGQQYMYYEQSPSGYSTPTSTAFSTGGQSPRYSDMASPSSTLSRSSYYNGSRQSGRRLSVPAANPYQIQQPPSYSQAYFSPIHSGQSATFSQNSSVHGSPTSSVFSHGRRDSESEMDWRRRTWHPSTTPQYAQRPATSGLTYHQTPDEPRPAFSQQQAASQMTRLPGIESFDHAPPPGVRQQDAMMLDPSPRPTSSGRELQQGLTRLDITAANAPVEGQWQAHQGPPAQQPGYHYPQVPPVPMQYVQPKHMSMPEPPVTPRRNKRNAWYGGPIAPHGAITGIPPAGQSIIQRPSPEDSGSSDGVPTPSTSQGGECNPMIVHPNGANNDYAPPGTAVTLDEQQKTYNCPPQQPQPPQTYILQPNTEPRYAPPSYSQQPNNDMSKLDALVAVATSEGSRAAEPRP